MEKQKGLEAVKWGEIYYCDLGETRGSVQSGRRPVLVVQTNQLNRTSPTVIVAMITTVRKKEALDTHVFLNTACGLKHPSMVLLEQLRTVDKAEELLECVGKVEDERIIREIQRGLKFGLGMPIKPKQPRRGIVLSLCPRCRQEFMSVSENLVRRMDPFQEEKELCDKCQVGYGYDYLIMKKYHRGGGSDV